MNDLTISAHVTKDLGDAVRGFGEMPRLVYHPILEVTVTFCHRINGSRSFRSIIVAMQARQRGQDDDGLRCELLQSATIWQEGEIWSDENPGDPGDEWTIQTIDPDGVLKWLGIDFETFKKYQKNDQPVRLIAPASR